MPDALLSLEMDVHVIECSITYLNLAALKLVLCPESIGSAYSLPALFMSSCVTSALMVGFALILGERSPQNTAKEEELRRRLIYYSTIASMIAINVAIVIHKETQSIRLELR